MSVRGWSSLENEERGILFGGWSKSKEEALNGIVSTFYIQA